MIYIIQFADNSEQTVSGQLKLKGSNGNLLKLYEMDNKILEPFKKFYKDLNYEEMQFVYKTGYSNILTSINGLLGINVCISNEKLTKEVKDKLLEII